MNGSNVIEHVGTHVDLLFDNYKYHLIVNKMGKAKKIKVSKSETKIGLADQIELEGTVKPKNRQKIRHRTEEDEEVGFHIFYVILQRMKDFISSN